MFKILLTLPRMNFLMTAGRGDPNTSQEFQEAVEALFGVSYTAKFRVKKSEAAVDYAVMPLEGLWWAGHMVEFSIERKEDWKWTVLIMQPEYVTREAEDHNPATPESSLKPESFPHGVYGIGDDHNGHVDILVCGLPPGGESQGPFGPVKGNPHGLEYMGDLHRVGVTGSSGGGGNGHADFFQNAVGLQPMKREAEGVGQTFFRMAV